MTTKGNVEKDGKVLAKKADYLEMYAGELEVLKENTPNLYGIP